MSGDAKGPNPPDLSETAAAIARGRELVKQMQRSADALERQVEQAHATIEQSGQVLGRSQELLNQQRGSVKPPAPHPGSPPSAPSTADDPEG